jgi:hypothetical protein
VNYNWGCACAKGFVALFEGLDLFRLGATGGKMNQSDNLSFVKRILVGWMSGS